MIGYLNDQELPEIERQFLIGHRENAQDNTTLDNSMYTDFTGSNKRDWTLPWASLTEAEYNAIKAIYDNQFVTNEYPTFSVPDLGIEDVPVRMSINPRDIADNCLTVEGVEVTLREA